MDYLPAEIGSEIIPLEGASIDPYPESQQPVSSSGCLVLMPDVAINVLFY